MSSSDPTRGDDGSVAPSTSSDPDLAARLAELEAIYRATPVALCVVDRNLRFTRANHEFAEALGRRVDDIIGRSMEEVVNPQARDLAVGLVKNVIETGRAARNLELPGLSRTDPSEERLWLVNVHPVTSGGKVTGVIGVLQDVTAMKQLERTAHERLEELESIYRNLPIGLALIDTSLRYVRVNSVLAELNGLSVEEHVGRPVYEVVPGLDPGYESHLRDVLDGQWRERSHEARVVPMSDPGVEHVLMVRYEIVRSEEGEVSGLVASVLDVTDRVHAEEEAQSARARAEAQLEELEMLYANTPAGLCMIDRDLRVLRINDVLAHAIGLPREENVGRTLYELTPGLVEQIAEPLRLAFELARPGVSLEVSGPLPADPSHVRTWLVNVHPLRRKREPVHAVVAVVQDITTLKRQQAELADAKERLEEAQRMTRVGSWEWNIVDDVMWWSDELYQLTGRSRASFEPSWTRFFELVHKDDRPEVRRQLEATLERDVPYWVEFRIVLDDLSERVLRCAARLERSGDGLPERLFGTCQDVTNLDAVGQLRHRVRFDAEST